MTRPPSPVMRRTVAGLTLSAAALVGIVLHEGYTDRAVILVKGELLRWRFFRGKDCALPSNARLCGGLATRREAEYRQCIGEVS